MLTDQEVAAMRETNEASLPDRVTILRRTLVSDGGGGFDEVFATLALGVPAHIGGPLGGETDERNVSRVRLADEALQTVRLPAKTEIDEPDRIIDEETDTEYEVIVVLKRGAWEISRRVRVKEL